MKTMKTCLAVVIASLLALLSCSSCSSIGTPSFGDAPKIRIALIADIEQIGVPESPAPKLAGAAEDQDSVFKEFSSGAEHAMNARLDDELYTEALGAADGKSKHARNRLLRRYIVRIQNYHEVMNNDIFVNTVFYSSVLDVITVVTAAIATAATPVSAKTLWAAAATISGSTKLALSRNILQEKSANAILATMISERSAELLRIQGKMHKSTDEYSVDEAIIDLNTFMNTGSLDKSAAQVEAAAAKELRRAEKNAADAEKAAAAENEPEK